MAKLIADINGRRLFSDKPVTQINNSIVKFADGSWIDMSNGDKFVRGHDDITVDPAFTTADTSAATEETIKPKRYDARNLEVRNVPTCRVVVKTHDAMNVLVSVTGKKAVLDGLRIDSNGDTVIIDGPQTSGGRGNTIITGSSGTIHIGGGSVSGSNINIGGSQISFGRGNSFVSISSGNEEPDAVITVHIPVGGNTSLDGMWHSADVGDIMGDLRVVAKASGDVIAGNVNNASLTVQGSADITVAEAHGDASISIMGSGDIKIQNGIIRNLTVNVMGSGDASIGGYVTSATLSVMGSGDIRVSDVKNRPSKSVMGSGSIRVGNH